MCKRLHFNRFTVSICNIMLFESSFLNKTSIAKKYCKNSRRINQSYTACVKCSKTFGKDLHILGICDFFMDFLICKIEFICNIY